MRRSLALFGSALLLLSCGGEEPTGSGTDSSGTSGPGTTESESSGGETDTGVMESYPPGPYGIEVGDVFAPYEWVAADGGPFMVEDLYGIEQRVLMLYATAAW